VLPLLSQQSVYQVMHYGNVLRRSYPNRWRLIRTANACTDGDFNYRTYSNINVNTDSNP
jgi:hypothetical protein